MEIEGEDLAEKHTVEKSESERGDEKTVDCGEHLIEMSMKILEDMVIQDKKVARNILLFLIKIFRLSHTRSFRKLSSVMRIWLNRCFMHLLKGIQSC